MKYPMFKDVDFEVLLLDFNKIWEKSKFIIISTLFEDNSFLYFSTIVRAYALGSSCLVSRSLCLPILKTFLELTFFPFLKEC